MKIVPVSKKFKEAEKRFSGKISQIKKENEQKQKDFANLLYKESGIGELKNQYYALRKQADIETRELHSVFLQEIYEGKHGRGELFLVLGNSETPMKVRRLIFIGDEKEKCNYPLKRDYYSQIYWRSQPLDPSDLYIPETKTSFWAEVGLQEGRTTHNELEKLFAELKGGMSLNILLKAFPPDFLPPVDVGEVLSLGRCSHHSGDIECFGIVLPTGRLAIVSIVSIYSGGDKATFHGVATSPFWTPDLSAKYNSVENAEELEKPTTGEIDFLRGKKIKEQDIPALEE